MKLLYIYLLISLLLPAAFAEPKNKPVQKFLKEAEQNMRHPEVSPVRRIEPELRQKIINQRHIYHRNINGSYNNIIHDQMNATDTQLIRITDQAYGDGINTLGGKYTPNPRDISNAMMMQDELVFTNTGATDFLWQWGQFLDHDIDLTDGVHPAEPADISIPAGDPQFDPGNTGTVKLTFNRSVYDPLTGTDTNNPRQQINEITGWIDASNVYGSDEERAAALRRNDGSGKLKTSKGNLLPFNTNNLPNAGGSSDILFLAGDVRANEQVGLTAMHTLFVREHNRLAHKIAKMNPKYSGDKIYQAARRIVAAQMQVITYNEFLPILLGDNALPEYQGYRPDVDARVSNEFSTAAYRLGHSLLSPNILRIYKKRGKFIKDELPLRNAFFAPHLLTKQNNIDSVLRGLASQQCQELDAFIIDDVRNFLFGEPGMGGFDLAALNIQRGRDHGLMSYNQTRIELGMAPATSFADISSDPDIQTKLSSAYDGNIELVDLWTGGLAEDKVDGAMVGPVFYYILRDQFTRLRDGDRFWYENNFSRRELRNIKRTTLAKIIRSNTKLGRELQNNVFLVKE